MTTNTTPTQPHLDDVRVMTFRETKVRTGGRGGWSEFVEAVQSGQVRLLVSRRPRGRGPGPTVQYAEPQIPLAAAVPADWTTRLTQQDKVRLEYVSSYHTRQNLGQMCEDIHAHANNPKPLHYVVAHGRRTSHTRTYREGEQDSYTRQARGYQGDYQTIALVSLRWLARALNTTVQTLEDVGLTPQGYVHPESGR